MTHETALQGFASHFSTAPVYMAKAASLADEPIERLKMVICMEISSMIYNISFEKPLNPILGETFEARG